MNYYFANEKNEAVGPFTADQMRQFQQEGTLNADTWVIEEGVEGWKTYAAVFPPEHPEDPPEVRTHEARPVRTEPAKDAPAEPDPGPKVVWKSAGPHSVFTKHAFISHSSRDHELAEYICKVLESFGVICWIAPRDINPGAPYDEEILRGIESSQTFLLLLSDSANDSPHVKRELMVALRAGHAVYPIRIQDVQPGPRLEYLLEGIHWVEAWNPPIEANLERLAQLIADADQKASSSPHAGKQGKLNGPIWKKRRRPWRILIGSLVTVLILLLGAWALNTWKGGAVTSLVTYLTQKVDLRLKGSEAAGESSEKSAEKTKAARHAALLAQARQAASNLQWQAAMTACEAALALSNDQETRDTLASIGKARDLEQETLVRRGEFERLLVDAGLAEQSGDYAAALKSYERAAASAPTDEERATAQEKSKAAADGLARQKKAEFQEFMFQGQEAETRKDWQGAMDFYGKALAVAPDETLAALARTGKSQIVAYLDRQAKVKSNVNKTLMLSNLKDPTAERDYPGSEQVLDDAGNVIGEICFNLTDHDFFNGLQTATLAFKRGESGTNVCVFRKDDIVGQIRMGKADNLTISGRVIEIVHIPNGTLDKMTIQVLLTSDPKVVLQPAPVHAVVQPFKGNVPPQEASRVDAIPPDEDSVAGSRERTAFDSLLQRGMEAEGRRDWQSAKALYLQALAAAPDTNTADQVRARGRGVMAHLKGGDQSTPTVNQTVSIGLSSRKILAPGVASSAQIRDSLGKTVGIVSLVPDNLDWVGSVTLVFKGKGSESLLEFDANDSVGTTREADAEGLLFTARVMDVQRGQNGSKGSFIRTMQVRVTVKRADE